MKIFKKMKGILVVADPHFEANKKITIEYEKFDDNNIMDLMSSTHLSPSYMYVTCYCKFP